MAGPASTTLVKLSLNIKSQSSFATYSLNYEGCLKNNISPSNKILNYTLKLSMKKWDVIREIIHRAEKHNFEILIALHRGENEECSEKKLLQKLNSIPKYAISKVKVAKWSCREKSV